MMSRIRWIAICGNIVASIAIGVLIGVIGAFTTPVHAADMNKVIRTVFPVGEEGFDPAASHDLYSGTVEEMIFETLFTYDYLGRPAKVVPLTAEALPHVTDEGRTYTIRLRKGIHFTPDPAFKGAKRELVAADYVYSLMRLMDPKIRSPWTWLFDGKIVGLDELAADAKKTGTFNYAAKVPGLEAVDRYTLRVRLKQPDYNLPYVLAHGPTAAVAREVVAAYADAGGRVMSNPVGTGPYRLAKWIRSSKIFLEANPDFRGFVWDFNAGTDPEDAQLVREMKGKKMPQVGRVEISIMEEDQSRLLAFQNGELDLMNMEGPLAPKVLNGGTLTADMQKKGVKLSRLVDPELQYHYWNMTDPVVGGLSKEKIALRRAMAMSYPVDEEIKVVRNGQAVEAQFPIPPGRCRSRSGVPVEREVRPGRRECAARQVRLQERRRRLAHASGRQAAADPLRVASRLAGRQMDEMWKKTFDSIGIRMEVQKDKFAELLKLEKQCKLMMRTASWIADYPDADNFMQLLYGKNVHQSNNACAVIPEYDKLYEQSLRMPDSPERNRLYREMARVIEVYAPWRLDISRYRNMLVQPRVLGFKKHPILHAEWQYIDVAPEARCGRRPQ